MPSGLEIQKSLRALLERNAAIASGERDYAPFDQSPPPQSGLERDV